jgi:hypothetical protein
MLRIHIEMRNKGNEDLLESLGEWVGLKTREFPLQLEGRH